MLQIHQLLMLPKEPTREMENVNMVFDNDIQQIGAPQRQWSILGQFSYNRLHTLLELSVHALVEGLHFYITQIYTLVH